MKEGLKEGEKEGVKEGVNELMKAGAGSEGKGGGGQDRKGGLPSWPCPSPRRWAASRDLEQNAAEQGGRHAASSGQGGGVR